MVGEEGEGMRRGDDDTFFYAFLIIILILGFLVLAVHRGSL